MAIKFTMTQDEAITIGLNVLNFLAGDNARLERFLSLTGTAPQTLRSSAENPAFLAGVLDYLLEDETLVYMFASTTNTTPDAPGKARRMLVSDERGEFN